MPAKFDLKTSAPREQLLALGQQLKQHRKANKLSADAVATAAEAVSENIDLKKYPQLKLLTWHVQGTDWLTPQQAWDST